MILGDNLHDADIYIDFVNGKVDMDYTNNDLGNFLEDQGRPSFLFVLFYIPVHIIFSILLTLFLFYHRFVVVPYESVLKINQVKHLKTLIKLYKIVHGTSTRTYINDLQTTSISVESPFNILFDYDLTGDYEKYCESITLLSTVEDRKVLNHVFTSFGNNIFTITFSQIPKKGTASITYI